MKTDRELRDDVLKELEWDPSVNATHIGVAVEDGIVTLSGYIDSYAEKHAAETAVKRVAGVRGLAEDIEVRLPGSSKRADTDLAPPSRPWNGTWRCRTKRSGCERRTAG